MTPKSLTITLLSLLAGTLILIVFDETTLFLATLLLAVIFIRTQNKSLSFLSQTVGMWFALSVAPALHIPLDALLNIENGFLLQLLFSFIAFIVIQEKKPSLIGKLHREAKGAIAVIGSSTLAGFTAGVVSALIWQVILKILTL